MLRLIKLEFYYLVTLYHLKKQNKHGKKFVKHRNLASKYENKHSNI